MGDVLSAFFIFLALFLGTFLCGYLPSCISAPPHIMNKIAIFGGGTIIGAAIIIVLPEASGIVINAQNKLDIMDGKLVDEVVSKQVTIVIGASIMLGFSLMMTIDETFKIIKESQAKKALQALSQSMIRQPDHSIQNVSMVPATTPDIYATAKSRREEKQKQSALLTTIALCVHSLAEGVAMGSSLYLGSTQTAEDAKGSSSVGLMITLALFFHKAPEAAGYGTFIVHMNCPLLSRVTYLAAYAISSPFSAFIAFSVFASQSQASIDDPYRRETLNWWTGFTLLIAVGTLTYITLMHILPEVFIASGHEDHDHFGNDEADLDHQAEHHQEDPNYQRLEGGVQEAEGTSERGKKLCGREETHPELREKLLNEREHSQHSHKEHDHDHEHSHETKSERFWKICTLLAGLYTAELLRFV